jgi:cyclic lactone autoinducer peptide
MNKIKKIISNNGLTILASIALMVTTMNVNSTCVWLTHQPELPEKVGKLRRHN